MWLAVLTGMKWGLAGGAVGVVVGGVVAYKLAKGPTNAERLAGDPVLRAGQEVGLFAAFLPGQKG